MKLSSIPPLYTAVLGLLAATLAPAARAGAPVLFQDDFTGGIPGWTAVQPAQGSYLEGPMVWQYDASTKAFAEQSNIYTENASYSFSRIAVMLINQTVAPGNFTYTARLSAGDDDAFGLIFGYQDEATFYRLSFTRQNDLNRTTRWPFIGWHLDRMDKGQPTDLYGPYSPNYNTQFVNTQNRPFDVTVTVNNNLLTVTVVDDPLGSPVTYDLVSNGPLPVSAAGKVGMFSWGMGNVSANTRGFRIQNPVLSPTPLAGNPAGTVLANWSFLVTPRTDGTIPSLSSGGPPIWSQNLDKNGDRGTLMENSDWTGDLTASSTTNFASPTAVAGDVKWSNYVYSARFLLSDNDGFGMLLRYQNETNFYRIALRNQAGATTGIKTGLTVQKNVNRSFSQIFANSAMNPPLYTPLDVHAFIRDNRLQIITVADPLGAAPKMTYLGPIDITGSTVDQGKIGVFSWAQWANTLSEGSPDFGTEVDSVRVQAVNGEALLVNSAYGSPSPAAGVNDLTVGSTVTASVDPVVNDLPGTRRILTGWQGTGSVPASGDTNSVTFTLSTLSMLEWKWRTEYQLSVAATPGGTVSAPGSQYLPAGTSQSLTATPAPGYVFLGWAGASAALHTNLTVVLNRPLNLLARFAADADADGLADEWELASFGNLAQGGSGDADGDSRSNLAEYLLGSNPTAAEPMAFSDGLTSRWINEARDRGVPGWFVVTNFGPGFRGVWENSGQFRGANDGSFIGYPFITATNYATNASFQGPLMLVRTNVWNPAWARTFSLSAEYTVGDDDGCCLYFRYLNESNWYRVTIQGQNQNNTTAPLQGVTIQARTNGYFTDIPATLLMDSSSVFDDPHDFSGFKKLRITVNGTNDTFEVRVLGWDTRQGTPDWNPNYEKVLTFTESSLPTGRIGIGSWGMGYQTTGLWLATNGLPVGAGMFVDNLVLQVEGTNAFVENWETATQAGAFPAGWENPYAAAPPGHLGGDWNLTAHGTIASLSSSYGSSQSGTAAAPKGDVEGPLLLAPAPASPNYTLELGIQPMDDGAMGFVYDFVDTNNFARVLFDCQVPAAGQLPQGLNVSRKVNGVWKDLILGDTNFVYTSGRPFEVRFANNNGTYTLLAWNQDEPATIYRWQWADQPAAARNRFGLAIWNMPDAHFTYLRSSSLPAVPASEFRIRRVATAGGNLVLDVVKPLWSVYTVQRAAAVEGPYVDVATDQNGTQYVEPLSTGPAFYRLVLKP